MIETHLGTNEILVSLLSDSEYLHVRYAAARIEELERQLAYCNEECRAAMMETCIWKHDGDHWETSCSNTFWFAAGGPCEDGFEFCPYCGKRIIIASSNDEPEESNGNIS